MLNIRSIIPVIPYATFSPMQCVLGSVPRLPLLLIKGTGAPNDTRSLGASMR
uniref:Putative LOC101734441 [Xenopus (Silurana) tropicalis] n=1 Tax=Lepeophtheirus salmonis TaxID=72036 RepID=A0A0K2T355_LEPSM